MVRLAIRGAHAATMEVRSSKKNASHLANLYPTWRDRRKVVSACTPRTYRSNCRRGCITCSSLL